MCPRTMLATGACAWQSLCSDNSGVMLFWLGKLHKHDTNAAELEVVLKVLSRLPPYSTVTFYTDQSALTAQLDEARSRLRSSSIHRTGAHHRKICQIIDMIRKKHCEVSFVRDVKHPLYLNCHKLATKHRVKFSWPQVVPKSSPLPPPPPPQPQRVKCKKTPQPMRKGHVLARNKRKWS